MVAVCLCELESKVLGGYRTVEAWLTYVMCGCNYTEFGFYIFFFTFYSLDLLHGKLVARRLAYRNSFNSVEALELESLEPVVMSGFRKLLLKRMSRSSIH